MAISPIEVISTAPYDDQKPGTSGLRKKVTHFQQPNYLANFVQALFNSLPESEYKGRTLLVSGDGRYWSKEAIHIIAEIAAGNGVSRLWVGANGWCSTPAGSCIIREREGGICRGGILLTASHNPGGPTEDFGIKYNCANGGPAPESITNAIYQETLRIKEYKRLALPPLNLKELGVVKFSPDFCVEVINPVEDWLKLMKSIFDFSMLKRLVARSDFSYVYDGLNGIAGPYARAIFLEELGCSEAVLRQCEPLEDFGGSHPDPNLTYAHRLVEEMKIGAADMSGAPEFGAAGDGDNDRNMILGRGWFVTPSDSVAIIAHYAESCIPYFKSGLKGVARSMPTSEALRLVSEKKGLKHFEVPTGWKFFGNLMDAGLCSVCGEESFGTGSDHIREKDGLWAVLAWMSIIAYRTEQEGRIVSVKEINEEFWKEYGRNYYVRYDYEGVESLKADKIMEYVKSMPLEGHEEPFLKENPMVKIDVFEYTDPVDNSVSKNQGVRVFFQDGSRFVLRLSGTGSSGATIRLYLEKYSKTYEAGPTTEEVMKPFIDTAVSLIRMKEFTGREAPCVKT